VRREFSITGSRLKEVILRKIWSRDWSREDVAKYLGSFRRAYFTYAADPGFRRKAASGGSVSALLAHLISQGEIDGAVVLKTMIRDREVVPEFFVARTRSELIGAQGSKYTAVRFTHQAFPLIRASTGRVAVVALPCDAQILADYRSRHPEFDRKIALVITLFCGHNSGPALTRGVVQKLIGDRNQLEEFTYRTGHWRGNISARATGREKVVRPFSTFSDFQNLYFFSQRKCHHCIDHTGYSGDLSAGDIWSRRMKDNPIKHTALISRTTAGEAAITSALKEGVLVGRPEPIEEVLDGQARTLPFHFNVTARSKVGRVFGERIKDTVCEPVRWNDYCAAFIVLLNEKISRTRVGRALIFRIPRPLLRAYLYVLKALESF
jgi:coenzyme F420-reducing hydrogenase beta subunit